VNCEVVWFNIVPRKPQEAVSSSELHVHLLDFREHYVHNWIEHHLL